MMEVSYVDHMGSDLTVVNAARVSYDKISSKFKFEDERLIKYLAKHGHWSPFAHAFLQFRIKAPIFVARQLAKHQIGLSWNEVSRRYVDNEPEFFTPLSWRGRPLHSKQGSSGTLTHTRPDKCLAKVHALALKEYNTLLKHGVAPEQARMVLPQTMMTEWVWSGSLQAFARICNQRLDPHSQEETKVIASSIFNACEKLFPSSWSALTENIVYS